LIQFLFKLKKIKQREQILFPFKVVDRINQFDLEIEVNHGGMSCLAKAIRYAVSKALCCFVSADSIEKLRLAGLLSADLRLKERKKPGQEGARRKYTWLVFFSREL
jgi:small subunit ribosomal protein S9